MPAAPAAPAASVASPCISVCRMDERSGWCEGCLRTLDEIAAWSSLDDRARRAVWKLLPQRRELFQRSREGGA
jgi:predicted Fe-S protein YdhL (DUF1289 family)